MDSRTQMEAEDEINLIYYWRLLWRRRRMILCIFAVGVLMAAAISFCMDPVYRAYSSLLPVESSQGRYASAVGSLQGIPLLGGAVSSSLGKTAADKLVSILSSRTIAEDVIRSLNLSKVVLKNKWDETKGEWKTPKPPTLSSAAETMQKEMVKVSNDRKGLITITVEFGDPKMTADIANEYTAALHRFLNTNAISLAKRNRIFLEKQLEVTRADLRKSEEELKGYQTKKKIVALDHQAEGAIKVLAEMKAQIMMREVQLGATREFATKDNPDVKWMEDQLKEMKKQLKLLEAGPDGNGRDDINGALISLTDAPGVGLQYARLKRDALVQQKVFELLVQQYEMAKIDEAKDDITFQVVDRAFPPEKRIKPKRVINVMLGGLASLFLAFFVVLFLNYWHNIKTTRELPSSIS